MISPEQPWIIRPHHMRNLEEYREVGRTSLAIDKPVEDIFTDMSRYQVEAALKPGDTSASENDIEYYQDVYGTTEQSAAGTQQARARITADLMYAPGDTPIVIANQKDRICQEVCTFGEHCNDFEDPETDHIDRFKRNADLAKTAYSFNADTAEVHTTLAGLRRILDYGLIGIRIESLDDFLSLPDAVAGCHQEGYLRGIDIPEMTTE